MDSTNNTAAPPSVAQPSPSRTIVLDLDDTLCDFMNAARDVAHRITGYRLTDAEVNMRWLNEPCVYSEQDLVLIRRQIFCRDFYMGLLPLHSVPATRAALASVADKFDRVQVVTARLGCVVDHSPWDTSWAWFSRWGLSIDSLKVVDQGYDKHTVFSPGTFGIVDDNVKQVNAAARAGYAGYLISSPWNADAELAPGVIRCRSFLHAAKLLSHGYDPRIHPEDQAPALWPHP
jgi:hypothetical protein